MSKFNFFRGFVSARIINLGNRLTFLRSRYPRIPIGQIPYPENYETTEEKRIFSKGWRACERGMEIHDNPYSNRENLIYSLHQSWERGWLECYHHHPSRQNNPTNLECYQRGQEFARNGFPLNSNPFPEELFEHTMFVRGWNDYIDNH